MIDPVFLGLGGKYGAGKDVIANFYRYEFKFKVIGFSDILNEMLCILDPYVLVGVGGSEMFRYSQVVNARGYVKAKELTEVRRLLQVMGTDIGRKRIHEDLWVDLTAARVQSLMEHGHNVVLTGVRFPNEVDMVRRLGGTPAYVIRPGFEDTNEHSSELSVGEDDFDYTIVNDSDISALEEKAASFYLEVLK